MTNYDIAAAKSRFSELVQKAMPGEVVIIAKDNKPVARLISLQPATGTRKPGSGRGQILDIATDFDATPAEFADYTE